MSRAVAAIWGLAGLLAAALLAAAWFLLIDTGALQSRAETVLSDALRTEAAVRGGLRVRWVPTPRLVLDDVAAGDDLRVDRAELIVAPLSLLRAEPSVRSVTLRQPEVRLRRAEDGRFRFAGAGTGNGDGEGAELASVRAVDARLSVVDEGGDDLELSGCEVQLESLRIGSAGEGAVWGRLSFDAELSCERVAYGTWTAASMSGRLEAADGVLQADPVSLELLEGSASGRLRSDLSGDTASHRLDVELDGFSAEALLERLTDEPMAEGTLALEAQLSSGGLRTSELWRQLEGTFELRGEALTLHGVDLDERVSEYESASAFDLYDVGAVLLVGPLGLVATRGRDYARLLSESGESTDVERLHSQWRLDEGVATAHDVALRTAQNLVALRGALHLREGRYDDLTVAVVDASGCAFVEQRVSGDFDDPEVDSPSVLEALAAPAIDLLERAAELFGADGCDDPFYDGALGHPRNDG